MHIFVWSLLIFTAQGSISAVGSLQAATTEILSEAQACVSNWSPTYQIDDVT